jgi:hypothetical protein
MGIKSAAVSRIGSTGNAHVTSGLHPIATKQRTCRHFGVGPYVDIVGAGRDGHATQIKLTVLIRRSEMLRT